MEEHDSIPAPWGNDYPWTDNGPTNGSKIATIQDLKMVFGFALRRDADGDGLVDYQELQIAVHLDANLGDKSAADPDADADNDGFSNITEVMAGTNATSTPSVPSHGTVSFEVFTPLE